MRRPLALLPLLLLPLTGCATTADTPAQPGAALTPAQVVAARQAAFILSAATVGGMRATVDAGGEVKPLTMGARGLARWAESLPTMFPDGTHLPSSRARAEIWRNRADFEDKAEAFRAATAALLRAAEAGDPSGFKTAYGTVGAACSACHTRYRAEAAR